MGTRLSRYCEGIMEAAWLAAVLLVPVFFNIYSSRIFEPDKIAILRSLALIILGAWIVKLIESGRAQPEGARRDGGGIRSILGIPMVIPVVMFAAIYLISTLFSVTPRVSLWGSYQRLQGMYSTFSYLVIFAALLGNLRRREQIERLVTTIIISSLPVSLYGFLQRYKIDPIPWGGDVSRRIASNMGNSIFVAAYLIMVFPLTVGRIIESLRAIWRESGSLPSNVARATVYIFTAAVQLIAIYMSGSRGPVLGLLAGSFVLFVLLSRHWERRWLTSIALGLAVAGGVFLAVFNIPNGPLESLRRSPAIGRFGLLLDAESNSALVRRYIWEGTVDLVSPHEPLQYPDGSQDAFNFLRPLIGYGPESMYVAFNPFYIPELGQVERRNASPDRAHNETWDAMVITGALGLAIYLGIFLLVFYYGLTWLGLVNGLRQRILFLLLCAVGGAAGSFLLVAWRGVEYIALGLPLGIIAGLVFYILYAVYANPVPAQRSEAEQWRSLALIVLLVAVFSHFLEINFGIAIAVTRTYFWTYTALMVLIGFLLPRLSLLGEAEAVEAGRSGASAPDGLSAKENARPGRSKKGRRSERARIGERGARPGERSARSERRLPGWVQRALPEAGILALLMITLGYNFISNSPRLTSALSILWSSLTRLPNQQNAFSPGILALVLTTWLAAGVLLAAEKTKGEARFRLGQAVWPVLAVSGGVALLFWLWHAGTLASLVRIAPENIEELKIQVGRIGSLLTSYYFYFLAIVFGLAFLLPVDWPTRRSETTLAGGLAGVILAIACFWIIYFTNIRVVHADIAFKMAEPFNRVDQWPIATELYRYTNLLAPDQDHYYLFLGRSFLEQAKAEQNTQTLNALVAEAEEELKIAQRKNPLNTDHTANLARLNSWWAARASDPEVRAQRAQTASSYYETAVTLSPQNSTLWGEWAILYLDVMNNPQEAHTRLERALALDTRYNWTQGLMGDYYFRTGQAITDTAAREQALGQALLHYEQALEVSLTTEQAAKISYLAAIGNTYVELKKYDEAIAAYTEALALGPAAGDLWRIEETIARTYLLKGDRENALQHAGEALAAAPEDQAGRINELIAEINGETD